jgi:hypothetical protein
MYWHNPGTIETFIRIGWNEIPDSLVKVVRNIHLIGKNFIDQFLCNFEEYSTRAGP